MIEAAMIWNEPNNKSHWDPQIDPEWALFAEHVTRAGEAIRSVNRGVTRVLGGMSPIDPHWLKRLDEHGALEAVDVVAVHGFPLDWNLWPLDAWPDKIAEIKAVTDKPVWVTEVGISSFGAEEVQVFGLQRTAALLKGIVQTSDASVGFKDANWCLLVGAKPRGPGMERADLLKEISPLGRGVCRLVWRSDDVGGRCARLPGGRFCWSMAQSS